MRLKKGKNKLIVRQLTFFIVISVLSQLPYAKSYGLIERSPSASQNETNGEIQSMCLSNDFHLLNKQAQMDKCTYKYNKQLEVPANENNVQNSLKAIQNSFQVHQSCTENKYCYGCCFNLECQELTSCNILYELKQNQANLYVMLYTISLFAAIFL